MEIAGGLRATLLQETPEQIKTQTCRILSSGIRKAVASYCGKRMTWCPARPSKTFRLSAKQHVATALTVEHSGAITRLCSFVDRELPVFQLSKQAETGWGWDAPLVFFYFFNQFVSLLELFRFANR